MATLRTGLPLLSRRLSCRLLCRMMCGAALAVSSAQAQAPIDMRVALVIGNAAYANAPLPNPANDARAMSEALRAMGFKVFEVRDASRQDMQAAIAQAGAALSGHHGVGLLYYAGHGLQLDWHNYMVPVDAHLASAADVPAQTVDVQVPIDAFRRSDTRMNIVVLDACRDSPFAATASAKGLAQMDAPPGTLLAFATAPGNVADDGDAQSGNGLYTRYLLQELKRPAEKIEDVFKRVRLQVRQQSQGRQVPWESTSLEEDFYFDSGRAAPAPAPAQRDAQFGDEQAEWARIQAAGRVDDVYAFLARHPSGYLAERAQFELDRLQRARVEPGPARDGVAHLPSGAPRYLKGDTFVWEITDGFSKSTRRHREVVVSADDQRVVFSNGHVSDQMGGIIKHYNGTSEPAILQVPSDLSLRKRWRTAFVNTAPDGTVTRNFWDFKVVALEDLPTRAGVFKAYKVEGRGESANTQGGGFTLLHSTGWIDPATMIQLRFESLFRTGGKITEWQQVEIVAMRRVPR